MKTIECMHKNFMSLASTHMKNGNDSGYEHCMNICLAIRGYATACFIDWRSWEHMVYNREGCENADSE